MILYQLIRAILLVAVATGLVAGQQNATARPDPREIPVPAIATSMPAMPGVDNLPSRPEMPDVLTMNNGQRVTSSAQWKRRREEMKRILEYYAVGQAPPPPGNVKGHEVTSQLVMNGKVRYRLVHLAFGPQASLSLDIGIFTPTEGGPAPAATTPPAAAGRGGFGGPRTAESMAAGNQALAHDFAFVTFK
jgi:hypothetical protein